MQRFLSIVSVALLIVLFGAESVSAQYGSTDTVPAPSTTEPPVCGNQVPQTPVLYQPWHPLLSTATKPGEVKLHWTKAERADHYIVAFGLSSGNYIYGAPDVGNVTEFTVSHMVQGKKYYFAVMAGNGCMPSSFSNEEIGIARGGSTTKAARYIMQAKEKSYYDPHLGGSSFKPVNDLVKRDGGVSF